MASVREIAKFLGITREDDRKVTSVSGFVDASAETVCFAVDTASVETAIASPAALILAPLDCGSKDSRLIEVRQPRAAFALVYREFFGGQEVADIHPTAVIAENARVGAGSSIGPHVVVNKQVVIGSECRLMAGVVLYPGTVLGDRVVVQAGAVLGSAGFGYVRLETGEYVAFPQIGTLVIEDDVEIGALTTIDRGALGETRIGKGTKIDNLVHIGHNCLIGKNVVIAAQTGLSGSTVVGDGAVIGGQVGVGDHVNIGPGVVLGSGAGVLPGKKLKGPGQVFWGIPAQPLKAYLRDLAWLRRGKTSG